MKIDTTYEEALKIRSANPWCFMRIRWARGGPKGGLIEGVFIRRHPLWLNIQLAMSMTFHSGVW